MTENTSDTPVRLHGTIIRIHRDGGYGFILGQDGCQYFVLASGFPDRELWTEDTAVTFSPGPRRKPNEAKTALDVKIAKGVPVHG